MISARKTALRQSPASDYTLSWDRGRNECSFSHKNGIGGKLSCGIADVVTVFSSGKKVVVSSINYAKRYACIEIFEPSGMNEVVFAEATDVRKIFGNGFASASPKKITETLMKEAG